MRVFIGYFVWGLILAAPVAWLIWKLDLMRALPRWFQPRQRRAVRLPPPAPSLTRCPPRRRADDLRSHADKYQAGTRELKNKMWWRKVKVGGAGPRRSGRRRS